MARPQLDVVSKRRKCHHPTHRANPLTLYKARFQIRHTGFMTSTNVDKLEPLLVDALAHAARLDSFAVSLLSSLQAHQDEGHRIFLLAQSVRSLIYFCAVCTLVESQLYEPAGAVLRVLLEQMFVLKAVRLDPSQLDVLAIQAKGESGKALNGLLKLSSDSRPEWLTDVRIKAELEGVDKTSGFNAQHWADKSGHKEAYDTLYRRLNVYSHSSLAALSGYLPSNDGGQFTGVRKEAERESAPQFLVDASSMMLEVINIVASQAMSSDAKEEFALMSREQHAFHERLADILGVHDEP